MSSHGVIFEGAAWPSTEALFQALRFAEDSPIREVLRLTRNPMQAKTLAHGCSDRRVVEPLSLQDLKNLAVVLTLKMQQHQEVRDTLASTQERPIVEDVTKRRAKGSALFWGAALCEDGLWEGLNWLGTMWMRIRDKGVSCDLTEA